MGIEDNQVNAGLTDAQFRKFERLYEGLNGLDSSISKSEVFRHLVSLSFEKIESEGVELRTAEGKVDLADLLKE